MFLIPKGICNQNIEKFFNGISIDRDFLESYTKSVVTNGLNLTGLQSIYMFVAVRCSSKAMGAKFLRTTYSSVTIWTV